MSLSAVLGIALSLLAAPFVFGQRLEFDVASVKPSLSNGPSDATPHCSGDVVTMRHAQLVRVFAYAYNITGAYQFVPFRSLPDGWNWYDIEARVQAEATEDEVPPMI
jgi:uncharacterized protein (TIGR03435 family)